jgi:hypothetical protein
MRVIMDSIKPVLISHELSNIGKLDITLHGIAALFHEQLKKDGLINYLKGLDHLGFISKCHPGNHHKRWDYVCLQLYFLQKLKHSTFNTGLNKDTRLNGYVASNQEILQTFILFANIGHLEGTLSSEKGLCDFLNHHPSEKKSFLGKISQNSQLNELTQKVFTKFDFYKMKYLIALNYVLHSRTDARIVSAIMLILQKYLHEKDIQFEKLRILYFKIRKVCFVYLDSFHCQVPMQINLSKILVNIFSFDALFNPVDSDYESVLDANEKVLSKELYLSPKSSFTYCLTSTEFCNYLNKEKRNLDYQNFLLSLLKLKRKYVTRFPPIEDYHVFHFYLEKDAFKLFDFPLDVDYDGTFADLCKSEMTLTKELRKGLSARNHLVSVQHDMRKSLIFFTIILQRDFKEIDERVLLRNFNMVFHHILGTFNFDLSEFGFAEMIRHVFAKNFQKDVIRRYFLYLLKFLFEKEHRLNLFIKFQYRLLINEKNNDSPSERIYETSFATSKKNLIAELDSYMKRALPEDIENNIALMKYIANSQTSMEKQVNSLYSMFPIEIEEMVYSAKDLDKYGNSETRKTITDIDAILILFQGKKIEFYLIEGKKYKSGFKSACLKDLTRIKSLARNPNIFSDPVLIEDNGNKGGFLKIAVG